MSTGYSIVVSSDELAWSYKIVQLVGQHGPSARCAALGFPLAYNAALIVLDCRSASQTNLVLELQQTTIAPILCVVSEGTWIGDGGDRPQAVRQVVDTNEALVREVLRAWAATPLTHQTVGEVTIDRITQAVRAGSELVHLTECEFALLSCLAQRPGRTVSLEQLRDTVRPLHTASEESLRVHVSNLRRKLGSAGRQLVTVRNRGYALQTGIGEEFDIYECLAESMRLAEQLDMTASHTAASLTFAGLLRCRRDAMVEGFVRGAKDLRVHRRELELRLATLESAMGDPERFQDLDFALIAHLASLSGSVAFRLLCDAGIGLCRRSRFLRLVAPLNHAGICRAYARVFALAEQADTEPSDLRAQIAAVVEELDNGTVRDWVDRYGTRGAEDPAKAPPKGPRREGPAS